MFTLIAVFLFLSFYITSLPIPTEGVDQSGAPNYREHECPDLDYDAIVLGSGIGGLSTASVLAYKGGKKVLIVDNRPVYGGGTAPMYYKVMVPPSPGVAPVEFNVPLQLGMHYLASVPDALPEWCLITNHVFEYHFVDNPYDTYVNYTGAKIMDINNFYDDGLSKDAKQAFYLSLKDHAMPDWVDHASAAYPFNAEGFNRFGDDFVDYVWKTEIQSPPAKDDPLLNYSMPLYMDEHFGTTPEYEGPKELATMYAEDLGVWSSSATFSSNAYMMEQFIVYGLSGLKEGATGFHKYMAEQIEKKGCIQTYTHVDEIIIENGIAVGARMTLQLPGKSPKVQEFRAPVIVSNMGIDQTFVSPMLPADILTSNYFDELHDTSEYGVTVLGVNFAYNKTGSYLGFPYGLIHMYNNETQGHDEYWAQPRPEANNDERFRLILFSFGSQRQPYVVGDRQVAYLTVMATVPLEWFDEWNHTTLETRPQSYYDWMEFAALPRLRRAMYTLFPEAEKYEIAADMFSPLTIRDRYKMKSGSYCGTNPEWKVTYPKSTLPGLWVVGKDQKGCGVQLSAYSGLAAALQIMGFEFVDEIPYMPGFIPKHDYSVPGDGKKFYIPPLQCVIPGWNTILVVIIVVVIVIIIIVIIIIMASVITCLCKYLSTKRKI